MADSFNAIYTFFKPELVLLLVSIIIIICFLRKYRKSEFYFERILWCIAIIFLSALTVAISPTWFMRHSKAFTRITNKPL